MPCFVYVKKIKHNNVDINEIKTIDMYSEGSFWLWKNNLAVTNERNGMYNLKYKIRQIKINFNIFNFQNLIF